jgi:hypothetical protein
LSFDDNARRPANRRLYIYAPYGRFFSRLTDCEDIYLQGKIDHGYSLQGRPFGVFVLNVTDLAMAKRDAGGAAACPLTPDEFRTRSSGSAYPLAPTAPDTATIEGA